MYYTHFLSLHAATSIYFNDTEPQPLVLYLSPGVICLFLYRDNCNTAHFPDDCNPDYSIQTPPVDIDILSDEVSYQELTRAVDKGC